MPAARLFLLSMVLLPAGIAWAWEPPDTLWTVTYDNDLYDRAETIIPVSGGGYLTCGHTGVFGSGDMLRCWLVRFYDQCDVVWQHTYSDPAYPYTSGWDVCQIPGGDFVVAGTVHPVDSTYADIRMMQVSTDG